MFSANKPNNVNADFEVLLFLHTLSQTFLQVLFLLRIQCVCEGFFLSFLKPVPSIIQPVFNNKSAWVN